MSYETYHAIKQQPNGDFIVTSHSSNVTPARPQEWTMSYYRTHYPDFTNEQRVAAFLLESQYCGGRYIPEKWQRLDAMTMKSKRVGLCSTIDGAKVFRMTQADIDKLVKRLPAYMNAETIKI